MFIAFTAQEPRLFPEIARKTSAQEAAVVLSEDAPQLSAAVRNFSCALVVSAG